MKFNRAARLLPAGLFALSLAIIAAALGRGLTQFGQTYLGESLGQKVSYDLRNDVYDHIQRMSYAYHDQMETGQIMSRTTQDVENIRMFFAQALFRMVYIAVLVVVLLFFLWAVLIRKPERRRERGRLLTADASRRNSRRCHAGRQDSAVQALSHLSR